VAERCARDDRKVAGILCETRWQGDALQWLAVGSASTWRTTSGRTGGSGGVATRAALQRARIDILDHLVPALLRLTAHGAQLTEFECAAFARRDWLRGRQIRTPLAVAPRDPS